MPHASAYLPIAGLGRRISRAVLAGAAVCAVIGLSAPAASAQSLDEAMAKAYRDNPTLQARRAQLRAVDEGVPQALSGWRPSVEMTGTVGGVRTRQNINPRKDTRTTRSLQLEIRQNLYNGGSTAANVAAAEADVLAERARLLSTEQSVLFDAVSAYMDVVRDQAVLSLNQQNERRLRRQLEATRDRFEVGEVTRTDVAQAESRLSRASSDRIRAAGNLEVSRATYERVVGAPPGELEQPTGLVELPSSRGEAVELAGARNPDVSATIYDRRSALSAIDSQVGDLLPDVDVVGTASHNRKTFSTDSEQNELRLTAELTVPIYQQGFQTSEVREAKQRARQALDAIEEARRAATEDATSAWETYRTSLAEIEAIREEVRAAEIALEGVQQEATVGQRTVLDVLDAEQELLDARVSLVEAERDLLVARYDLLGAVGGLTARDLGLDVDYYDPYSHYSGVRNQVWGLGEPAEASDFDADAPPSAAAPE
ncbi:MAG: TolC family outer membrane protein [Marivibrio sp.]|uniref:TolC family outer membrane protein n=1 Tax=Marivibrio sp. TaxID=2039719 RepID=UPI0032EB11B2